MILATSNKNESDLQEKKFRYRRSLVLTLLINNATNDLNSFHCPSHSGL
jgi:hypothetical protein